MNFDLKDPQGLIATTSIFFSQSNDQEFHRAIQALYDKGQQFYEENFPKGKDSDVDVQGGEDRISLVT